MSLSARAFRSVRTASLLTQIRHASTKPMAARVQTSQSKSALQSAEQQQRGKMLLMAAMPQLVPFYWVNEVAATFVILPTLIYLFSKYWLPQTVRGKMARLFISKL